MKHRYLILGLMILLLVSSAQAAWMTGWDYRKSIHINGSATDDLTNYQIMIGVYNTTGSDNATSVFISTKAYDDTYLSDVRFTASDGTTLIDIWNETYYSDHGDIWIECPTIDDTTGWDGYIYYGNSGASSVWNGTNTFPFFDHFEGTSLDTGKWTYGGGAANISISSSIASIWGYQTSITGRTSFGQNYSFVIYSDCVYNETVYWGFYNVSASRWAAYYPSTTQYRAWTYNGTTKRTDLGNSYTGYRRWEGIRNNSISIIYNIGTSNVATHTQYLPEPTALMPIRMYHSMLPSTPADYYDYCFVYQYYYPCPVISTWGTEESSTPPPVAAFSGTPLIGYPSFNVVFTDASTNTPTGWYWDFGDGDTDTVQNPTHTYNNVIGNTATSYTVCLNASNGGGSDWENKTAYVTEYPLQAGFSGTPTSGTTPLTVTFTDTTTNGTPTGWSWDFGDGTTGSGTPIVHQYTTSGLYTVALNASNAYSWDIETKTGYINVGNATATPTPTPTTTTLIPTIAPDIKPVNLLNMSGLVTVGIALGTMGFGVIIGIVMLLGVVGRRRGEQR